MVKQMTTHSLDPDGWLINERISFYLRKPNSIFFWCIYFAEMETKRHYNWRCGRDFEQNKLGPPALIFMLNSVENMYNESLFFCKNTILHLFLHLFFFICKSKSTPYQFISPVLDKNILLWILELLRPLSYSCHNSYKLGARLCAHFAVCRLSSCFCER